MVRLDDLRVHLVDEEAMVAALPHAVLSDAGRDGSIALRELAGEPFILTPRHLGPSLVDVVLKACLEAGFEPRRGQSAPQIAAVLALVAAEFGVSVVPASMRQAVVTGVRYLEISDVRVVASLAIVSRRGEAAVATQGFVDMVRAQVTPGR